MKPCPWYLHRWRYSFNGTTDGLIRERVCLTCGAIETIHPIFPHHPLAYGPYAPPASPTPTESFPQ